MIELSDDLGRIISIPALPIRTVSLVPSITCTIFELGYGEFVVGRTKFCVHPREKIKTVPIVGGTKKIDIQKTLKLNPDLIIANKEENSREDILQLSRQVPVFITDISNLNENKRLLNNLGKIFNAEKKAAEINCSIEQSFAKLKISHNIKTLYVIWQRPYMSIGADTFINAVMVRAGFENIFSNEMRYPEFTIAEAQLLQPEIILLSSEPYPFKEKHIASVQNYFPNAKILLADGEMFSWYGSKMTETPSYLIKLLESVNN